MARIKRGAYELSWEKGGVEIRREGALLYYNRRPLYAFLKTAWGICEFYDAPYRFVRESGKAVEAGGELETPNGSCLSFLDRYEPVGEEWKISRRVVVERAGKDDRGFATKLSFVFAGSEQVRDYDCFAPATWYRDNRYARPYVIGFDPDCEYFWRKETALTLPLFAAQNRKTGETIRFSRWAADVTLPDEGLSRSNQFIDASYTVGALGLSKPENKTLNTLYYGFTLRKELPTVRDGLSIDYVYPGAEGQEWGRQQLFQIDYMMSTKTLSRSFHPVAQGFSDSYAVGLALSRSDGFYAMMRTAWRSVFARLHDTLLQVDQEKQYKACVAAMKKLTRDYGGGAWGVPFAAYLPAVDVDSVSLQFGFVGQQPGIAYQLMAYGAREGDAEACEKGRRVIQFWVDRAANGFGMPNGCYSPVIQAFEPYPIWLRMSADGLENILDAYVLTKKRGEDHADWLAFCRRAADWLVSAQNEDGSYYRAYNQDGSMRMDSKANTISIVRFLVQLYLVTKEEAYRQTALRAGEWSYHHVYEQMEYRGSTCDSADIMDNESGIYAMFGFLSLYDLTHEAKWLEALIGAADYTETWTYSWSFPIRCPFPTHPFSKNHISGQSPVTIGDNGGDMYMAACAYVYYRLYVITGDRHYRDYAEFIHSNTRNANDVDGSFGYALPGLSYEGGHFTEQVLQSHHHWLPWVTYVEMDPTCRLLETFGAYDIAGADKMDPEERARRNRIYDGYAPD